jgi:hypothetical protein
MASLQPQGIKLLVLILEFQLAATTIVQVLSSSLIQAQIGLVFGFHLHPRLIFTTSNF